MISQEELKKLTYEGLLEESTEELYNNAPCGYFSTLTDGTFVKINNTFLQWLGYNATELLYVKRIQDLLQVGDVIFYDTHFLPLLQMQGFLYEINFALRRSDGTFLPVLLNTTQVKDRYGKPVLHRTTLFNITDRKKYELELLHAKKIAEEAAQVKADFLSTVSHEIRTPLNAIVGIVNLLGETPLTPKQAEYLRILQQSSSNLLTLINDILDFSKIEAGKVTLQEKSFAIREMVNNVIYSTKGNAVEKGLTFRVEVDEQIPQLLEGDPIKLRQVLTNLVGNAIKFTDKGFVDVRLKLLQQQEDRVDIRFEVADTGIGIQPDQLERIFEEFSQASSEISQQYGGTGLGLAISQRLLALYKSRLQVESEPGKGASFYFDLSLKPGKSASAQQERIPAGSAKGLKVLLAEDNNINVYVVSQYLKKWGVDFDVVNNGAQAVEQLEQQVYDLVLMDLQMPVLDGYEASRRIRQLPDEKAQQVPIVALTASAKADYEGRLQASGIDGILAKPFDPQELYTLLVSYNAAAAEAATANSEQDTASEHAYSLDTFDELMADDKAGMLEILNITIATLQEARLESTEALRRGDAERYTFWLQQLETSLELLQARRLQEVLQQGKSFLSQQGQAPDVLQSLTASISEQFEKIIAGLDSKIT
ncbi:ATP-binding protein [Pontibacter roseus]|uniref:ATP-binding protein n=1 Tax=Pontibacter roseus TaxID=336989 RepID=UPI00036394BC|nr:ATP-binding protein [Pontibacter roseus]